MGAERRGSGGGHSAVVRFLGSMQVDVEPEYQPYLDRFPLPK